MAMIFDNAKKVEILTSRWSIRIGIVVHDGSVQEFVASADAGWTGGDGIFFDTLEEYNKGPF